jgi:hypothetical protein
MTAWIGNAAPGERDEEPLPLGGGWYPELLADRLDRYVAKVRPIFRRQQAPFLQLIANRTAKISAVHLEEPFQTARLSSICFRSACVAL